MKSLQPLGKRTIVRRDEAKDTSEGGIHIPDQAQQKMQTGTIVAVGGDVNGLFTGDRIIFQTYGFTPIEIDKQELLVIHEDDIMIRIAKDG
jgi:chaperonin GroES